MEGVGQIETDHVSEVIALKRAEANVIVLAADDTLPKRLLEDPTPSGSAKGKVNELSKMMPEYYTARGWTKDGVPSNETLARLAL